MNLATAAATVLETTMASSARGSERIIANQHHVKMVALAITVLMATRALVQVNSMA